MMAKSICMPGMRCTKHGNKWIANRWWSHVADSGNQFRERTKLRRHESRVQPVAHPPLTDLKQHESSISDSRAQKEIPELNRDLDLKTGSLPLRKSVNEPTCAIAFCSQQCNRFKREHAVRAAAISNELLCLRQSGQALLQLVHRDIHGARQMSETEFMFRSNVD